MSAELDAIAAKIRENVRKRADGDIDVMRSRKAFEAMGKLAKPAEGVKHASSEVLGVRCDVTVPAEHDRDRSIIYFHGGAFALGAPEFYRAWLSHLAVACRAEVWAVDYRLAPEHPFPAAPDDALRAWRGAQTITKLTSARVVMMGDSAGANLTLATMIAARDAGLPLPAAAVLISPWIDLALGGASVASNRERDPLIREGDSRAYAALYAGQASTSDARISPLHGALAKLPPTYVQVGKDEILYDDATRFEAKARAAGVDVTLDAFDGVFHVWHLLAGVAPEANDAISRIGEFVRRVVPSREPH